VVISRSPNSSSAPDARFISTAFDLGERASNGEGMPANAYSYPNLERFHTMRGIATVVSAEFA
jgi:hypothetical protein